MGVVAAVLVSLAGVWGAGEYVLDQPAGGAPGFDGGSLLLLLILLLLMLVSNGWFQFLLILMLMLLRGVESCGEILVACAVGGVGLDGGSYLGISLRL